MRRFLSSARARLLPAFILVSAIQFAIFSMFLLLSVASDLCPAETAALIIMLNLMLCLIGMTWVARLLSHLSSLQQRLKRFLNGDFSEPEDDNRDRAISNAGQALGEIVRRFQDDKDELIRKSSEFERQLAERTADLERANLALRGELDKENAARAALLEANRELSKTLTLLKETRERAIRQERYDAFLHMAKGIAHDFNNALTTILGHSDYAANHPESLDNKEEMTDALKEIRNAARQAQATVGKMRLFYSGNPENDYRPLALNEVIEAAVAATAPLWKEELRARGQHIEVKTDLHDIPPVVGAEAELREAVVSILLNAFDAMPRNGEVTIRTAADAGRVLLTVSDTGAGMDRDTLARCFEPFFTTKGPDSAGLGLASVYGIVQRHMGVVTIESEPGKGATVAISLPACLPPAETPDGRLEIPGRTPSLRILVVDDEAGPRRLILKMLRAGGHFPTEADSGEKGLAALRSGEEFDLLLTDRALPDMSGDAVAAEARKLRPALPIIMLTGFGDVMIARWETPPGVNLILSKPVLEKDLLRTISDVIGGSRKGKETQ